MAEESVESRLEGLKVEGEENEKKKEEENEEDGEVVDPWTVKTTSDKGIDYDKLISE